MFLRDKDNAKIVFIFANENYDEGQGVINKIFYHHCNRLVKCRIKSKFKNKKIVLQRKKLILKRKLFPKIVNGNFSNEMQNIN
jgi:hypothetical protein